MTRHELLVLKMPFEDDNGRSWFCTHCALIEGALAVNPHWAEEIQIHRIAAAHPRQELIERLGEEFHWLPALVLAKGTKPPMDASIAAGRAYFTDPVLITKFLAEAYGGAAPHP